MNALLVLTHSHAISRPKLILPKKAKFYLHGLRSSIRSILFDRVVADVTCSCHLYCFPIFHGLLQRDPPSDVHATLLHLGPLVFPPSLRQTGNSTTLNVSMCSHDPTHREAPGHPPRGYWFDVLSLFAQPVIVAIKI